MFTGLIAQDKCTEVNRMGRGKAIRWGERPKKMIPTLVCEKGLESHVRGRSACKGPWERCLAVGMTGCGSGWFQFGDFASRWRGFARTDFSGFDFEAGSPPGFRSKSKSKQGKNGGQPHRVRRRRGGFSFLTRLARSPSPSPLTFGRPEIAFRACRTVGRDPAVSAAPCRSSPFGSSDPTEPIPPPSISAAEGCVGVLLS